MMLEQRALEMAEVRSDLSAADLWAAENYFRKQGVSEFVYDEPIDVYRFAEDGRFAFCVAFADWERLQERGYLHFCGGPSPIGPARCEFRGSAF